MAAAFPGISIQESKIWLENKINTVCNDDSKHAMLCNIIKHGKQQLMNVKAKLASF